MCVPVAVACDQTQRGRVAREVSGCVYKTGMCTREKVPAPWAHLKGASEPCGKVCGGQRVGVAGDGRVREWAVHV